MPTAIEKKHIVFAALGLGAVVAVALLALRCGGSKEGSAPKPPEKPKPEAVSIKRDDILRAARIEAPDAGWAARFSLYPPGALPAPPPPDGRAAYPTMRNRVVRIAVDARFSWAPLVLRNRGMAPGPAWTGADGTPFQVELVRIDDPVALRDAFATGRVHAACGTVGVLAGWAQGLAADPRAIPRVFQQFDWSEGADLLVVRRSAVADPEHPKISDLLGGKGKGKPKIVVVEDSPGEEFAIRALIEAGIPLEQVEFEQACDPFQAAAVFRTDPSITACAGFTPEIHALAETTGNAVLATTARNRRFLAGIWFARSDFARDFPEVCEGLARGIFEGIAEMKSPQGRLQAAERMADVFGFSKEKWLSRFEGSRPAGPAENRDFFLNRNNPANFQRIWENACVVHKALGEIAEPLPFTSVFDAAFVRRLVGTDPPAPGREVLMESPPAVRKSIRFRSIGDSPLAFVECFTVSFAPNRWELPACAKRTFDEVARLVSRRNKPPAILVEGHADASRRGKTDAQLALDLSMNRAQTVKTALLKRLPNLPPSRISTTAHGWSCPTDPTRHTANRRVEITILPAE